MCVFSVPVAHAPQFAVTLYVHSFIAGPLLPFSIIPVSGHLYFFCAIILSMQWSVLHF